MLTVVPVPLVIIYLAKLAPQVAIWRSSKRLNTRRQTDRMGRTLELNSVNTVNLKNPNNRGQKELIDRKLTGNLEELLIQGNNKETNQED